MLKILLVCVVALHVLVIPVAYSVSEDLPEDSFSNESVDDVDPTLQKNVKSSKDNGDYDKEEEGNEEFPDSVKSESFDDVTLAEDVVTIKLTNDDNDKNGEEVESFTDEIPRRFSTTKPPKPRGRQRGRNSGNKKKKTKNNSNAPLTTSSNVDPEDIPTIAPRETFHDGGDGFADNVDTVCPSPPEIEGANAPLLEDSEHPIGTVVNYQCPFGHVSRSTGSLRSVCRINERTGKAEWTPPNVTCIPRSCGDPGYVSNGRRIGNLFTFPNKVEFECLEGFKLRGLRARYCQAGGEWSGRLPTCEQIYCSAPSDPVNGRALYSSLEYGSTLEYECNKGFMLRNYQARLCSEDGKWSNIEPECIETRCEVPEQPEHGSVQVADDPKVGSLAFYSCDDGATLSGPATSKCLSTGDWTFDPKCFRSCTIPVIQDGKLGRYETVRISKYRSGTRQDFIPFQVDESIKHDETVIIQCSNGFSPGNRTTDRTAEVVCSDGVWSKSLKCEELKCSGEPPPIENGEAVVDSSRRTHGKTIWYKCNDGYEKTSSGRVICNYGKWEGPTPTCGDNRCYVNQLDYPGLRKPEEAVVNNGNEFDIECEAGYTKSSFRKSFLCLNGQWNIKSNPCTPKACDDEPPVLLNGKPRVFSREHGSVVDYKCNEHFYMTGSSSVQCQFGEWEGQPPVCNPDLNGAVTSTKTWSEKESNHEIRNPSSPVPHLQECFCHYDYRTDLLVAYSGGKMFEGVAKVRKGESVLFACRYSNMDLVWPNGMRFRENGSVTCHTCRDWPMLDLPYCDIRQTGDAFIVYDAEMKILPGGRIEAPKLRSIKVTCRSPWTQPIWNVGNRKGIGFYQDTYSTVLKTGYYTSYMIIRNVDNEHSGRYECYTRDSYTTYKPSFVDLEVTEPEVQCRELQTITNRGNFIILYEDERRVNSKAQYICEDSSKELVGESHRICLASGNWSGTYPTCRDKATDDQCPLLIENNSFLINYSNDRRINSVAYYYCKDNKQRLIGSSNRTCLHSRRWSGKTPICEDITCLEFPTYNGLIVSYSMEQKVNSIARFQCSFQTTLVGSTTSRCLYNGTWSHHRPACENSVSCERFADTPGLEVSYSDGVRVGSTASFRCAPPSTLVGRSTARCRSEGIWSQPLPKCQAPNCSIDTLMESIPHGVIPDMTAVTGEFLTPSSELPLLCEDNLILIGTSKATCGFQGLWEYGNVQCVPGCRLNEDVSPLLKIDEVKEYYRFGEAVLLSCPPGHKLSNDVERLVCLSSSWSHPVPSCMVLEETSPSGFSETTKKTR